MPLLKRALLLALFCGFFFGCASSRYYHLETKQFADIEYGFEVKSLQIRNIKTAFIDEGSGDQVLLLIHGLGSNAKGWIKNISVLAEHHRVIAVDLPGYGKSDKGYYNYSMDFYAGILKQLLEKLQIKKAVFIGHSMGGQIAITSALKYPEIVEKLILISPAGIERFTEGEGDWMIEAVTEEFVHDTPIRNIDINVHSNFYEMPADAAFMSTDRIAVRKADDFPRYCYAVARNVEAMINGPVWDKLNNITQPVLFLFGENDGLIPNPYLHGGFTSTIAEKGHQAVPGSQLIIVPQCGHFVQFEKADQTNAAILSFIDN